MVTDGKRETVPVDGTLTGECSLPRESYRECACMRACVHAFVCACMRACVHAFVRACSQILNLHAVLVSAVICRLQNH